jgi:hypothetical protein
MKRFKAARRPNPFVPIRSTTISPRTTSLMVAMGVVEVREDGTAHVAPRWMWLEDLCADGERDLGDVLDALAESNADVLSTSAVPVAVEQACTIDGRDAHARSFARERQRDLDRSRDWTPRDFIRAARACRGSSASFLARHRTLLTSWEWASITAPILRKMDAREVLPTPTLEALKTALAESIVAPRPAERPTTGGQPA